MSTIAYVNVTVALKITIAEGETVENVLQEMDYDFQENDSHKSNIFEMNIIDTKIVKTVPVIA